MKTANILTIRSELEDNDLAAVIEDLEKLPAGEPAVTTGTDSDATLHQLVAHGRNPTAGQALEILAA